MTCLILTDGEIVVSSPKVGKCLEPCLSDARSCLVTTGLRVLCCVPTFACSFPSPTAAHLSTQQSWTYSCYLETWVRLILVQLSQMVGWQERWLTRASVRSRDTMETDKNCMICCFDPILIWVAAYKPALHIWYQPQGEQPLEIQRSKGTCPRPSAWAEANKGIELRYPWAQSFPASCI